ncbi:hypothetical protein H8E07_06210 [bacterium]|nr:hypothetical protein [bacterium]
MAPPAVAGPAVARAGRAAVGVVAPLCALAGGRRPGRSRQVDIEVRDMLAAQKVQLADLFARHVQAADETAAREMRLEIRRLNMETEIRIYQAQVRHLRRQGLEEAAAELEAEIAVLTNPEARLEELSRPVERSEEGGAP